jgi:hypothetical protein
MKQPLGAAPAWSWQVQQQQAHLTACRVVRFTHLPTIYLASTWRQTAQQPNLQEAQAQQAPMRILWTLRLLLPRPFLWTPARRRRCHTQQQQTLRMQQQRQQTKHQGRSAAGFCRHLLLQRQTSTGFLACQGSGSA